MLNVCTVTGRITKDLQIRAMPNGKSVMAFAIACDRDYKDDNGDRPTDFIDCIIFGREAEFLQKYCGKGSLVTVTGRLELRKWESKDGQKRSAHEIRVDKVYFEIKRENGDGNRDESGFADITMEDIPF